MLSFELRRSSTSQVPDELEIYCDAEGLESLLAQLRFLKEARTDHIDLMAIAWGGADLDDQTQDPSNTSIRSVKILRR